MSAYGLRDWRWPDKSELSQDQQAPWRAVPKKVGNEFTVLVVDPEGNQREVVFEVDKGWLRVRAYLDPTVSEEPAGEIWLGWAEARYATPDDLGQDKLSYGSPRDPATRPDRRESGISDARITADGQRLRRRLVRRARLRALGASDPRARLDDPVARRGGVRLRLRRGRVADRVRQSAGRTGMRMKDETADDLRQAMTGPTSGGQARQLAPVVMEAICAGKVRHVGFAVDKFKALVAQMARFVIPGDADEAMRQRLRDSLAESGYDPDDPEADPDDPPFNSMSEDDYVIAGADDDFLCSETRAFWDMVREARKIIAQYIATNCNNDGLC
jgi:hypothetical protein